MGLTCGLNHHLSLGFPRVSWEPYNAPSCCPKLYICGLYLITSSDNRPLVGYYFTMPDDSGFRFVLESPHVNRAQKKRPRLVTSCDNWYSPPLVFLPLPLLKCFCHSRTKKIKCIQKIPETNCEACSAAGVSCRFKDKERYYAERSRIAAAHAATSKSSSAVKSGKGSSHEHEPPITLLSSPLRATSTESQGGPERSPPRRMTPYHPYRLTSMSMDPPSRSSPESDVATPPLPGPLFDPNNQARPHSQIMMSFIQAFFDNLNMDFPFLAYDETMRQFFQQTLSPALANCIAAHAVRYVNLPEVTKRGIMHVTDQYCDNAKVSSITRIWGCYSPLFNFLMSFRRLSFIKSWLCLISTPYTPSFCSHTRRVTAIGSPTSVILAK